MSLDESLEMLNINIPSSRFPARLLEYDDPFEPTPFYEPLGLLYFDFPSHPCQEMLATMALVLSLMTPEDHTHLHMHGILAHKTF